MKQNQPPAKEIMISDITNSATGKLRIVGSVVSKNETGFILDDTTGTIIILADTNKMRKLNEKDAVQAIGWITKSENDFLLRADFVKKLDGINLKLYRRVNNMIKNNESF